MKGFAATAESEAGTKVTATPLGEVATEPPPTSSTTSVPSSAQAPSSSSARVQAPAGPVAEAGPVAAPEVIRLPVLARGWRVLALLAVAGLFLAGTAVGTDNWWPFGPWRMYASSTPPSGSVFSLAIQVRQGSDPTWINANLNPNSVGLNRAEVEGRMGQMTSHPDILGTLAHSHARLQPKAAPWTAVRVIRNEALLSHGALTGQVRSTTLVTWPR